MGEIKFTSKEKKVLLVLFKEFNVYYNANSLSKIVGISRIGAMKILKKFLKENILVSQQIGKSIVYKINLNDDYTRKLVSFLLADEAHNFERWKDEFKELSGKEIVLLYGSTIKNYTQARDIDVMVIIKDKVHKRINEILNERRKILPKPLHDIFLTKEDMIKNVKMKKPAIIDTIKNAIVLYGQEEYVAIIKNVTSI